MMGKEYKCRFCNKSFWSMQGLKNHLKREHSFRYYLPRIILPAILLIIIATGLALSLGLRSETLQTNTSPMKTYTTWMQTTTPMTASSILTTSLTESRVSQMQSTTLTTSSILTAPEFILPEYGSGRRLGIGNFSGKPVFLEFFSPHCPHCLKMMPVIEKLYEKYSDRIVFIMVSYGSEGIGEVVEKYGLKPIILIDKNGEVFDKYKVEGVPTYFILDGDHNIYWSGAGEMPVEMLESFIQKVI